MFQFMFRFVGLFILALAVVVAVLDLTRSISASEFILTPLATTWFSMSPATLELVRLWVETWLHPVVWDPVLLFVLKLPTWLVLWFTAMLLLWIGQKRENPYGRFAGR